MVFPKEIINSSDWLDSLYEKLSCLNQKSILIAWGMNDIGFRPKELKRWLTIFPQAKVIRYENTGHFVAEERADELSDEIRNLI